MGAGLTPAEQQGLLEVGRVRKSGAFSRAQPWTDAAIGQSVGEALLPVAHLGRDRVKEQRDVSRFSQFGWEAVNVWETTSSETIATSIWRLWIGP